MPLASVHPSVIDQYLRTELEKCRVAGPFSIAPIPNLHISRFRIVTKKYQPGKWRLIPDFSSPVGYSANDGVLKASCSVQNIWSLMMLSMALRLLEGGSLLAKLDAENAYRHVPVHSGDHYLFGMKWQAKYFIALVLPFGSHLAPYIFSSFADLLVWILTHNYSINFLLHYLDNFHTLGPPNSPVCQCQYLCSIVFGVGHSSSPR